MTQSERHRHLAPDELRISAELRDRILLVVEADPVVPHEESRQLRRLLEDLPVPVDVWVMGEQEFEETKDVIGGLAYPAHKYGIVLNEIA